LIFLYLFLGRESLRKLFSLQALIEIASFQGVVVENLGRLLELKLFLSIDWEFNFKDKRYNL
jgi:hypothetical protein